MSICNSYMYVMDDFNALIELKDFFLDFFTAFDELLCTKINDYDNYQTKYDESLFYWGKMDSYFVTNYMTQI